MKRFADKLFVLIMVLLFLPALVCGILWRCFKVGFDTGKDIVE